MNEEGDRTLWCGNIHDKVTEELLYELFLQAGPLERVKILEDKRHAKYAFITFKHSVSVPYTLQLMNGIRLYDQPLRLKERGSSGNSGYAGGAVEAVPQQQPMGPPLKPPSLTSAPPSPMLMPPANLMIMNPMDLNIPGGHAGLLRSYSEPEGLGTNYEGRRTGNMSRGRERAAVPYTRPQVHQRPSLGIMAQNIASSLYMFNHTNTRAQQNPQTFYFSPHGQQNHYNPFNPRRHFQQQ